MKEPILTKEDIRKWNLWKRVCSVHAKTPDHIYRVQQSKNIVHKMYVTNPSAYIAWSAGKDSTAMVHLIYVLCGIDAPTMSIKDDCDFPGEKRYIQKLADAWNVKLDILCPGMSLKKLVQEMSLRAGEDLHSRDTDFANIAFYQCIERYRKKKKSPGVYLGMRSSESKARALNRLMRGLIYCKKSGEVVCQPICDWSDIDVFAYLFSHNIELFDVYKCCRLHDPPSKIRKSWWLPGTSARKGQMVWLRTYYPSIYRLAIGIMPDSRRYS
jgi:3'-phosphoadenosine 5'-phosphosulfate sulfotransferase (PAPS reductase)/FAD synthetase